MEEGRKEEIGINEGETHFNCQWSAAPGPGRGELMQLVWLPSRHWLLSTPVWTWSLSHAAGSRQHMCTCQYDVCLFVDRKGDKATPWVRRLTRRWIFTRGNIDYVEQADGGSMLTRESWWKRGKHWTLISRCLKGITIILNKNYVEFLFNIQALGRLVVLVAMSLCLAVCPLPFLLFSMVFFWLPCWSPRR